MYSDHFFITTYIDDDMQNTSPNERILFLIYFRNYLILIGVLFCCRMLCWQCLTLKSSQQKVNIDVKYLLTQRNQKLIEAITSKYGSKISEDILSYCMESCLFIWISANVSGIIPCHFNSGPNSPHRKLHVVNISSHSSRVTYPFSP